GVDEEQELFGGEADPAHGIAGGGRELAERAFLEQLLIAEDRRGGRSQLVAEHSVPLRVVDRSLLRLHCADPPLRCNSALLLGAHPDQEEHGCDGGDEREDDEAGHGSRRSSSDLARTARSVRARSVSCSGLSRSGRCSRWMPVRCCTSSTSAASSAYSGAARRIFWNCLRRQENATRVSSRRSVSSTAVRGGGDSGTIRMTAESTRGTGRNAPRPTWNRRSTRATLRTPTDSAPYSPSPGG